MSGTVNGTARIALRVMSTLAAVVLLFSYPTSTSGPVPTSTGSSASSAGSAAAGTTVDGSVASTRWGPVQVRITTDGTAVTGVEVLQHPDGNGKDEQINAYALPILVQETMDAQSADIDMVSGATVTSEGYVESLQAALDEAGL